MELQGRNLTLRMRGDDVALLQTELGRLGFAIDRAEVADKRFGTSTREAVLVGVNTVNPNDTAPGEKDIECRLSGHVANDMNGTNNGVGIFIGNFTWCQMLGFADSSQPTPNLR